MEIDIDLWHLFMVHWNWAWTTFVLFLLWNPGR